MSNLISIITVCYNAEKTIAGTIKSVLAQTYKNIEYIIIDGNSTDRTCEIVRELLQNTDINVKIISEPDNGIYDAMNKGLRLIKGDWVLFMNADDSFYSYDVLQNVFEDKDYCGTDVIYGGTHYIGQDKDWLGTGESDISVMPHHKMANSQATFLRRETHMKYLYNLKYPICADYDVVLRMYKDKKKFLQVPFVINNYSTEGISSIHPIKAYIENMKIKIDLGYLSKFNVIAWAKLIRFIIINIK